MFNKFSLIVLVVASLMFYLKYTESFYHACKKSVDDENFFLRYYNITKMDPHRENKIKTKIEKLKSLCKDFYVDFSSNFLMKNTIGLMNEVIYGNSNDWDEDTVKYYIESVNTENIKLSLYSIKFVHIFIYVAILYLGIVSIPNLAVQIILSILNKLLIVVFMVFIIEGIMKFYFGMDFDIMKFSNGNIANYLDIFPINYVFKTLNLLFKFI